MFDTTDEKNLMIATILVVIGALNWGFVMFRMFFIKDVDKPIPDLIQFLASYVPVEEDVVFKLQMLVYVLVAAASLLLAMPLLNQLKSSPKKRR